MTASSRCQTSSWRISPSLLPLLSLIVVMMVYLPSPVAAFGALRHLHSTAGIRSSKVIASHALSVAASDDSVDAASSSSPSFPSCSSISTTSTTPLVTPTTPTTERRISIAPIQSITRSGALRQGLLSVTAAAMGISSFFSSSPSPFQPPSAFAATNSVQDSDLPPVAFKTKSGLRYYDVRKGEGASPKWGQVAIIQYEGYVRASPFSKLVLFDDTYARKTPYLVKHGNGRVIRGLDEGLHTMRLGGLRRIVVPLELGYTKTGLGPLPPNAFRRKILVRELEKAETNDPMGEIVYDVELVSLYDDEADLGYYDDLTFDSQYLQDGMAKSLQELRDKGVKVPSTKTFMTKPEILGSRRQEIELNLPEED